MVFRGTFLIHARIAGKFLRVPCPAAPIEIVRNGQDRVTEQHSWASVAHDLPGLFPVLGLVAMDRAVCAGRFVLTVGALLKTNLGVVQKPRTIPAKPGAFVVG